jgi:hypothetical protein
MRDVAPGLEEAVDGDALLQMFAVVPTIEFGLTESMSIEVSSIPFPASGIFDGSFMR